MKPKKSPVREPQVGIIFYFEQKLQLETTPVAKGGNYGEFKIHEGDHVDLWDRLVKDGQVPQHLEYQDVPRGRVAYNYSSERYRLMLDRCILGKKDVVDEITKQLDLPKRKTDVVADPHYRCAECLRGEE